MADFSTTQQHEDPERQYLDDNEHHLNSLMHSLNRLRSLDLLTDLVVKSGTTEVRINLNSFPSNEILT
jgi:hypothetical protein